MNVIKNNGQQQMQQQQQGNRGPYQSQSQEPGCKIFVGGLTWNTSKEMLLSEFSKFGEVVDSIVMKNPETGNSRGFGFVTYKDNESAENAVNSGTHKIDGKIVDVKLCNPQLAAQQRNNKQRSDNCKVFVGGLPHGVTDDEIKQFFSRYGAVKEFKMMYDENKKRPRGFGFITFELEESANQVLQEHFIAFNGKQIEVKPQIHNIKPQYGGHHPLQQQQSLYHQHNNGNGWNNGGQNWNTNNGSGLPNIGGLQNPQGANGSWGGNYGGQIGGISQSWGYPAGGAPQPQIPTAYGNANPGAAQTANWNYNYYGQPQGYYQQADAAGTGTFNF